MKKVLTVSMLFLLASCATSQTSIISVKDPSAPRKSYKKIAIDMSGDLQTKIDTEKIMISEAEKIIDSKIIASHEIFLPTRKYTKKYVTRTLLRKNTPAILVGQLLDNSRRTTHVSMPRTTTSQSRVQGRVGTQSVYGTITNTHTHYENIPITTYQWKYKLQLVDLRSKKVVWYAETTTQGSGSKSMSKSLMKKTLVELCQSGLVLRDPSRKCSFK